MYTVLLAILLVTTDCGQLQEVEVMRLLARKLNKGKLKDWTDNGLPCDDHWTGVTCDGGGNITGIELAGVALGSIDGVTMDTFAVLDEIASLETIHLGGNSLSGSLPLWKNLIELRDLQLNNNYLTGSLVKEWGASMANIQYLILNGNKLTGPLYPEYAAMLHLMELDLSENAFSGSLEKSWGGMISMQYLYLSDNQLTGSLPPEWSKMTGLRYFYVNQNKLSGTLPDFESMRALEFLGLSDNLFSGTLPQEAWSSMTALQDCSLANNNLGGDVGIFISRVHSLKGVDFSGNAFEGNLSKIGTLLPPNLKSFNVAKNKFTNPPPLSLFKDKPNLRWMNISHNTVMNYERFPDERFVDVAGDTSISRVYDASGIVFLCPLITDYTSVLFIKPACNFSETVMIFSVTVVAIGLAAVAVLFKESSRVKLSHMFTLWHIVMIKFTVLSLLNTYDIYSDITMYLEVDSSINLKNDVCNVANNRFLFSLKVSTVCSLDRSRCDYPTTAEIEYDSITKGRNDFESYYHLTYEGNTALGIKASAEDGNFLMDQVKTFEGLCESLHRYPTSSECKFVPEKLPLNHNVSDQRYNFTMSNGTKTTGYIGCYQDFNPVEREHSLFRQVFYVSIGIYVVKELYKLIVLFTVLITGRNEGGRFSSLLYASAGSPLLFVFRRDILREIMKHEATANDVLFELVVEAMGENVVQLLITVYYASYIQEVGISVAVAFCVGSNLLGLLWKIISYTVKRRRAVATSRSTGKAPPQPAESQVGVLAVINPTANVEMVQVKETNKEEEEEGRV